MPHEATDDFARGDRRLRARRAGMPHVVTDDPERGGSVHGGKEERGTP